MDIIDNYILALLKVAKEVNAEITATKLQKIFFLLEKEGGVDLGLGFQPYLFGPFSLKLSEALDRLIWEGKVKVNREVVKDPFFNFVVGHKESYELNCEVEVPKDVEDFFRKWVGKTRQEILSYVYRKYPEYAEYSIIRDKVIKYGV